MACRAFSLLFFSLAIREKRNAKKAVAMIQENRQELLDVKEQPLDEDCPKEKSPC